MLITRRVINKHRVVNVRSNAVTGASTSAAVGRGRSAGSCKIRQRVETSLLPFFAQKLDFGSPN